MPDYKITSRDVPIPEEKSIYADTVQGVPNVRPVSSSISTRVTSNSLSFYWNPALPSGCEFFNADLDGYFYILKGIEPWNVQEERKGTTFDSFMTFQNLQPFSNYLLFVYIHTTQGMYNPDLPFKIPAETQSADKAGTPRALQVSASSQDPPQHHLTWLPPYPPTGIVSHYVIRWKQPNSQIWSDSITVEPSTDLCSSRNYTKNEYEKTICHTISSQSNVTYQVAAYNAGSSEGGDWSTPVFPMLDESGNPPIGIIVVGVVTGIVVLGLFILAVICLFSKCKNSGRYKNVPNYSTSHSTRHSGSPGSQKPGRPNSMPPPYTPPSLRRNSSSATATTTSKYQHLLLPMSSHERHSVSIQEQPLPPLPSEDPLYEELKDHHLQVKVPDSVRISFNKVNEPSNSEDEDEFLCPRESTTVQGEDGYLQPKALKTQQSDEEDDEYLAPTFNQFKRIDSRDLSPPLEEPAPIPMQSYVPVPRPDYSNQC